MTYFWKDRLLTKKSERRSIPFGIRTSTRIQTTTATTTERQDKYNRGCACVVRAFCCSHNNQSNTTTNVKHYTHQKGSSQIEFFGVSAQDRPRRVYFQEDKCLFPVFDDFLFDFQPGFLDVGQKLATPLFLLRQVDRVLTECAPSRLGRYLVLIFSSLRI